MCVKKYVPLLVVVIIFLVYGLSRAYASNVVIETFNSYENTADLTGAWQISGDISKSMDLETDATGLIAPGTKYLKYIYNGSGNGIIERIPTDATFFPLNITEAEAGLQFYLKGDGTNNKIQFRCYQLFSDNTEAVWGSQLVSLKDSTWHIIRIPFELDATETNGFHLISTTGSVAGTEVDLENCLSHIGKFQIYLDNTDVAATGDHAIYLDEFKAVDFFPPSAPIQVCLEDFESYPNTDIYKTAWQAFGYPTRDYELRQNEKSPEGYRNAYWLYNADETTTWGMAFRTRAGVIANLDISSTKDGGIQFLIKGDGTDNKFVFRFTDTENNYWVSYGIPLQDTTWHWATVPFIVDENKGFRWCGNSPDSTYWGPIIGTVDELMVSLTKVNEIRFDIRSPAIDGIYRSLELDAIYAVSELPPNAPIAVDDFESYTDSDDLKLSWNQFGLGSTSLELTNETAASGVQAMKVSYNGINGYTAVRKRNILPALDFSEQEKGVQFWIKGDGSENYLTFRLQNGNEMWESYQIALDNTEWKHWAVQFKADTIKGFRYLGNNPDNPVWSTDIGTTEQLYGDLVNIDQVRFYVRNPKVIDNTYSFIIDKIEGVDEFDDNIIYSGIITDQPKRFPAEFSLKQNHPNPFNPVTTLEYTIGQPGFVILSIYNLLGQHVKTLVNSHQSLGTYRVTLDASGLASGIYIYSLQVKDAYGSSMFVQKKKMILLK